MSPEHLRAAFKLLHEVGITSWDRFPIKTSLAISSAFSRVAFSSASSYAETFQAGFDLRQFNWYLLDLSYFQFSFRGAGDDFELRYAFFPNPFLTDIADFGPDLVYDELELGLFLEDAQSETKVPPVRYEYVKQQFVPFEHPTSHFHIGHQTTGRLACKEILTPEAFTLCILKWFYGEEWKKHQANEERSLCLEEEWIAHCSRLNTVGSDLMTEEERACLHFGVLSPSE